MQWLSKAFSRAKVYSAECLFCWKVGLTLRDKLTLLIETVWFHLQHNRPGRVLHAQIQLGPLQPLLWLRRYGGDIFIFHEVLGLGVYDFPADRLKASPKVIVDLGANIGLTTLALAARFPKAQFLCVEPHPENAELLRHNLVCLGDRAQVIEAAVADATGSLQLTIATEHYNASLLHQGIGTQEVAALTVPDLLSQAKIQQMDLLKMDIEGAEFLILKNQPAWLQPVQLLLAELHGPHQAEMVQWLREAGFEINLEGSQITAWRI